MSASTPCLAIGQVIGSYRVVRPLGEGAMGEVYEVFDSTLDRRAALKVVPPWMARDKAVVARFRREAMAASRVQHPGVVHIFEYGALPDHGMAPYFIMEYLEGETLHTRMKRAAGLQPGGCLGLCCLPILLQIATALGAVHRRGLVHRDLKPANVMLVADATVPGGERATLLDFGIVKILQGDDGSPADSQDGMTHQGTVLGTPRYMAPEQWKCGVQIDGKADVYALGVMTFLAFSGQLPFMAPDAPTLGMLHCYKAAPSLLDVAPNTAPAIISLVEQMLEKEPSQRPTMAAVAEKFARLQAHLGTSEKPAGMRSTASAEIVLSGDFEPTQRLGLADLQWDGKEGGLTQPLSQIAQRSPNRLRLLAEARNRRAAGSAELAPEPSEGSLLMGSNDNLRPHVGAGMWGARAAALLLVTAAVYFMIRMRPAPNLSQGAELQAAAMQPKSAAPAPIVDSSASAPPASGLIDATLSTAKGKKNQRLLPSASCINMNGQPSWNVDQQTAVLKAFSRSNAKLYPGEQVVLSGLANAPQLRVAPKSMSHHVRTELVAALKHQRSLFASAGSAAIEIRCPGR